MLMIDAHTHVFGACKRGVSTGERLIECMDAHGVSKAVLVGNPYYGFFNEVTRQCCIAYPQRFIGIALVDVLKGREAAQELEALYQEGILTGMAIESASTFAKAPETRMDSQLLTPVWDLIGGHKQPVYLHMFRNEDVLDLKVLSGRYPEATFICCHLGADACHGTAAGRERFDYLIELAKHRDNILFDTSSLMDYYPQEYPFTAACGVIEDAWRRVGAEKLLWGTDYPGTLRYTSYENLIDMVRRGCPAIPERELELIMGQNAHRVFCNKNLTDKEKNRYEEKNC